MTALSGAKPAARPAPRPLPRGVGLLLGAAVSLGLWAAIAAVALRLTG